MQETWFVFPNPTKVWIVVAKIFWVNTMIKKLILQELNGIYKWILQHWKNFRKCFGTVVEFNVHSTALHIKAILLFPGIHFLAMCNMFPTPTNFHIKNIYRTSSIQTSDQWSHILWKRTQHSTCFLSPSSSSCCHVISCPPSLEECYFPHPTNWQNSFFSSPSKCIRFISMGPLILLNISQKLSFFFSLHIPQIQGPSKGINMFTLCYNKSTCIKTSTILISWRCSVTLS